MLAVIFEVTPLPGRAQHYFDIVAELRLELDKIEGFISVGRFQSLTRANVFLSLTYGENDAAVSAWRNQAYHRAGKQSGRAAVFSGCRSRVVSVIRDHNFQARADAPVDSNTLLL